MGSRGPLPKGSKGSLKFADGVPPAPDWLGAEAQGHYCWWVDQLSTVKGHLQHPDMGALAMLAQTYADMVAQKRVCDDEPVTLESAKGGRYVNPEHTHYITLKNQYLNLVGKMGGTPADRQRINAQADTTGPKDPLAELLANRRRAVPPPLPSPAKNIAPKASAKPLSAKKKAAKKRAPKRTTVKRRAP